MWHRYKKEDGSDFKLFEKQKEILSRTEETNFWPFVDFFPGKLFGPLPKLLKLGWAVLGSPISAMVLKMAVLYLILSRLSPPRFGHHG